MSREEIKEFLEKQATSEMSKWHCWEITAVEKLLAEQEKRLLEKIEKNFIPVEINPFDKNSITYEITKRKWLEIKENKKNKLVFERVPESIKIADCFPLVLKISDNQCLYYAKEQSIWKVSDWGSAEDANIVTCVFVPCKLEDLKEGDLINWRDNYCENPTTELGNYAFKLKEGFVEASEKGIRYFEYLTVRDAVFKVVPLNACFESVDSKMPFRADALNEVKDSDKE